MGYFHGLHSVTIVPMNRMGWNGGDEGQLDCHVSCSRQGPSTDCSWATILIGFLTYACL